MFIAINKKLVSFQNCVGVVSALPGKDVFSLLFTKTNRRTNFPNLFCQETLHVSGSSSANHQEFSTVHSALVCVMQF
jgi:hypothetical protein